ncbi:hypothetical protein M438DRAFT_350338 [Aureobasidium pullulans EXF-150]|uniref:AB hydrolase-1 domain-containing protein n=1 Tax=Aureobasidium pullulans EXF-150 TaxID=1043002 RepID=A0A074XVE0_AURPU|nr:uncharacterized protein M438DRAFT_350338 [Aureobasidium pullulans EXF-150]KEQ78591.1 hypothetical protein M438DRAFT_350338 [Aureobasidium pullulans EXF-150]
MSTTTSAKDDAIAFASQKCFHQSITIDPTSAHQKLRVSFATTSGFDDDGKNDLETILICGGMGASRLLLYRLDALAKKEGVRVIFIDRPGVGGSTPVPLDQRVQVWLDAVPAVLEHLGVKTISLLSHSAGAIYAINTLLLLPHLLHPQHPYAAFLTPWVHPCFSSAPLMQVVDKLPSALVGSLHHITSFVGGYIAPSVQFSSGMMGVTDDLPEDQCQNYYDMSSKSWSEVCKLQGKYARLEDMSGISADANLCMQKDSKDWCTHTSLPTTISSLQQLYPQQSRPLTIRAYFAASDQIIGRGGQVYFEECWKRGNDAQGQVDFAAKGVDDTDHDNIPLVEKGCLGEIFKEIKDLNVCDG